MKEINLYPKSYVSQCTLVSFTACQPLLGYFISISHLFYIYMVSSNYSYLIYSHTYKDSSIII